MRRLFLLLLISLLSPAPPAPPLRLAASTTRSEFVSGERFTVSAYLFNDGDAATTGAITVTAPAGFDALTPQQTAGDIPAGRALRLNSSYRVGDATPGLYRFLVAGSGQTVAVVVRVGPVRAPPAMRHIYLPIVL